jgi:hypothetical protein
MKKYISEHRKIVAEVEDTVTKKELMSAFWSMHRSQEQALAWKNLFVSIDLSNRANTEYEMDSILAQM